MLQRYTLCSSYILHKRYIFITPKYLSLFFVLSTICINFAHCICPVAVQSPGRWANLKYSFMNNDKLGLLDNIQYPSDLRRLDVGQLPQLCAELRRDIVEELAENPGHLASSLGVVELTVALHYVFNTPNDRIVWDVGHQAYGHKILTGRKDNFHTNRKLHGIRPFPSPEESEYDTFTCGHASNSISAALGMAVAARKTGHADRHVVAVIGDGAMSGGLAFEGLNNVSSSPNDLLIVLNDNDMSIDRAVGGMEKYLLNLDTNATYNRLRDRASQWLHSKGYLNDDRRKGIIRLNNALKSALSHQQNIFEGMNIRYFGPFNGNDVSEVVRILGQLKDMRGPKLLHLHTIKGKGYKPAEEHATIWHAPGKFDPDTGERINEGEPYPLKYQEVFGKTLLELAKSNPNIVGVTPAMPTGCSMDIMMKEMPDRVFDVGIAEGHAATFSCGMAKDGLMPFCNIYSAFAQRAYDNIIHDAAILNLPVVFCFDRAGLVGEDGPTHHGVFDIAALRPVPNLTLCSPMDERELRKMMYTAQLPGKGTVVIRYPRGKGVCGEEWQCPLEEIPVGKARCISEGKDVAVLSYGPLGNNVQQVINELKDEGCQLSVAHYDMRFCKPLDTQLLEDISTRFSRIVTVEDAQRAGGFGSAVLEWMSDNGKAVKVQRIGLPDHFVEHGTVDELKAIAGIDNDTIKKVIKEG